MSNNRCKSCGKPIVTQMKRLYANDSIVEINKDSIRNVLIVELDGKLTRHTVRSKNCCIYTISGTVKAPDYQHKQIKYPIKS